MITHKSEWVEETIMFHHRALRHVCLSKEPSRWKPDQMRYFAIPLTQEEATKYAEQGMRVKQQESGVPVLWVWIHPDFVVYPGDFAAYYHDVEVKLYAWEISVHGELRAGLKSYLATINPSEKQEVT